MKTTFIFKLMLNLEYKKGKHLIKKVKFIHHKLNRNYMSSELKNKIIKTKTQFIFISHIFYTFLCGDIFIFFLTYL